MKVQKSVIVPLGYGKYVRADMVVLLVPILLSWPWVIEIENDLYGNCTLDLQQS